jgi:hypothetical protein
MVGGPFTDGNAQGMRRRKGRSREEGGAKHAPRRRERHLGYGEEALDEVELENRRTGRWNGGRCGCRKRTGTGARMAGVHKC